MPVDADEREQLAVLLRRLLESLGEVSAPG